MGLGQFGGGVGVAKFLASQGASVFITDTSPAEKLEGSIAQLAHLPIQYRLGEHRIEDFTHADLVIVNPAVKPSGNIYLEAARAAGVALTSEIRLLAEHLPNRARTIGITGSAGKSTTAAMVGHVMAAARERGQEAEDKGQRAADRGQEANAKAHPLPWVGRSAVHLGGNIGGSLLDRLDSIKPDDWIVLELSSFMLEGLREDRWSPHIALITNLAPNHLDWHGSFEGYRHAKQALLDSQTEDDIALLGPGAEGFMPGRSRLRTLSPDEVRSITRDLAPLLIPGEHNRLNAAMAIEVCAAAGIDRSVSAAALAGFTGLAHRMQLVARRGGVRYFNDSKATTPEAAMLALQCFDAGTVHVILGGYDKGADLAPLARQARGRCRAIYTIGQTGPAIADAADAADGPAEVIRCETLPAAVAAITPRLSPGDVVLLSPACASWGQFTHFEARGQAFIGLVG